MKRYPHLKINYIKPTPISYDSTIFTPKYMVLSLMYWLVLIISFVTT